MVYLLSVEIIQLKNFKSEILNFPLETREDIFSLLTRFLKGERLKYLKRFSDRPLFFQVSLDGATEKVNDAIRGEGCFKGTLTGLKNLKSEGFEPVLATALVSSNYHEMSLMPKLVREMGCRRLHVMWVHRKGRMMENRDAFEIPISKVIETVHKTKQTADAYGVEIDNFLSIQQRVNGRPGVKFDLSSAGVTTICVSYDGQVYPAASFVDEKPMACGSVLEQSLREIWEKSPVLYDFRSATLQKKRICKTCPVKFICGGGDLEHGYFYSEEKNILGHDPYCDLHQDFIKEGFFYWTREKKKITRHDTGYQSPRIYHAMGEQTIDCGNPASPDHTRQDVATVKSNCVLSYDIDRARRLVRNFYGKAAEVPQERLCCPTSFAQEDIAHIPQAVLDRFYGCGSPVSQADIQAGETCAMSS